MNKLLLRFFVLIVMTFVFTALAFAAGPASVYKVKLSKFELWNGTSWVTAFEGTSSALDIASVSAGAAVGNFLSGLVVPDGIYTKVRVTPSATFIYKGNDGAGNYTTAAAGGGGGSVPGGAGAEAEFTMTLTGIYIPGAEEHDFSATPITVVDGGADKVVRVSFNVANAIQLQGGELWPAPPVVTMSLQ